MLLMNEELLKNQEVKNIVEDNSEETEMSFSQEVIETRENETDNSADLKEFGVDTESTAKPTAIKKSFLFFTPNKIDLL